MRKIGRWMAAAMLLAGGACGGDGDASGSAEGPPAAEGTIATSTTAVDAPAPTIDWLDRDLSVDIGGGNTLAHCEGEAPVLCLSRDGIHAGIVELSAFPISSLPEVREALPRGEQAALEAHVEDFAATLGADRKNGCGATYEVVAEEAEPVAGASTPTVRYGFSGRRSAKEPVTERTVQWAAIRGENLVLVNLSGYDADSCLPAEGEGTVEQVSEVVPLLDRVVAVSPLPTEIGPAA